MPKASPAEVVDGTAFAQHLALKHIGEALLIALGEDPSREGLRDTPRRFASWWQAFIRYDPGVTETTFESVQVDQMVVVGPIRLWSICEHHPRILGLSKFARIARQMGHRLQVQERLVQDIARELSRLAGTPDVAVLGTGVHLCMAMRGVCSDAPMTTSVMLGRFRENVPTRDEFLRLAGR
jgi:GTP cyclohydrolase IA